MIRLRVDSANPDVTPSGEPELSGLFWSIMRGIVQLAMVLFVLILWAMV